MNDHKRRRRLFSVALFSLTLALLVVGVALAAPMVPLPETWAWGAAVGWLNFAPDFGGVTVYSDRLEGYAWGENVGWIRFKGTAQDTTAYGVTNDDCGNLAGYAWGTAIGWLNFAPANGGVWMDPVTGDFDGYAWGENVGWLHFQNGSPAYKVTAAWRGDLTAAYQNGVAAIITARRTGPASSNGLSVANSAFLNQAGDCIIFGHNDAAFAGGVTDNLPVGVDKRWARIWQLDVNDQGGGGGVVTLTFDISEAGGTSGSFDSGGTYFLLKRPTGDTGNFSVVSGATWSLSGDQLTFTVDASNLGSEFTLGATAGSPTAVTLHEFRATAPQFDLVAWVADLLRRLRR